MPKKLTNRQRRFPLAYAADPQHNGTRAALSAGCPKTSAHVMASRWLKNPSIQNLVEDFLCGIAQKHELSASRVVEELCKIAFANMLDYIKIDGAGDACVDLSGLTRDQAAAVLEIRTESRSRRHSPGSARNNRSAHIKLADKVHCLELLGKYLKLFDNRLNRGNGVDPVRVIVLDVPRPHRPAPAASEGRLGGQYSYRNSNSEQR
jgi:phage terminase small subunit